MMELFDKYAYWKILRYFAEHPDSEVYVKQISGILGISAGTCSRALRDMEKDGLLRRKKRGKEHFYMLEDNYLTKELKKLAFLFRLKESGLIDHMLSQSPDIQNIVLYGSHAKGDFTERSDVDILIIGPKLRMDLQRYEEKLGKEINMEVMTPNMWLRMMKDNAGFYRSVKENHIVLYGGELP